MRRIRASGGLLLLLAVAAGCRPASDEDPLASYLRSRQHLKKELDYYVWDDVVGHLHKPHAVRRRKWPEHADGRFLLATNNLGFREDEDTPIAERDGEVRVLVTGDSHTDGVVPNAESYSNVLQETLNARFDRAAFDVLNAGVGHYGPYHYPRVLERFIDLEPDLFLVTLYLGNDFLDACRLLEGTGQWQNPRPSGYYRQLQKYTDRLGRGRGQGFNQLYYFARFPHMVAAALDFSAQQFARLKRFSELREVPVIVLLLPTKIDLESDLRQADRALAGEILDLTERDLDLNFELAERFASRLRDLGIEVFDLTGPLAARGPGLYWDFDHHLSTRGHRAVAEILAEVYGPRFQALAAGAAVPGPGPAAAAPEAKGSNPAAPETPAPAVPPAIPARAASRSAS